MPFLQKIKRAILKDDDTWGWFMLCICLAIAGSIGISLYFNSPERHQSPTIESTTIIQTTIPDEEAKTEIKELEKKIIELENKINYGI